MVNTDDFSGNTALYKSIADCCRESVIIFDNYGDIKYANSVAIEETGYADGLVGINIISIYPMAFFISEGLLLWDKSLEYMQTFAYRENQTCYPIKLWCKVAKDFENLNFSNMVPILILGGFISCVVVGITVLFVARSIFYKVKNYFSEEDKDGGDKK